MNNTTTSLYVALSIALLWFNGHAAMISRTRLSMAGSVGGSPPPRPPVRYRYLRALPSSGTYNPGGVYSEYLRAMRLKTNLEIQDGYVKPDRSVLTSFYLGPSKLVAETITCDPDPEIQCQIDPPSSSTLTPYSQSKTILRSIVPVPIRSAARDDIDVSLMAAMAASQLAQSNPGAKQPISSAYSWKGAVITDRDRGLFDSLSPLYNKWLQRPNGAKDIYNLMKNVGTGSAASPYHCFLNAIEKKLDLKVTGILIEVADSPNAASLSLGAAVLVTKSDSATEWILTKSNYKELIQLQVRSSSNAKLLDCYVDEALGIHFATQIPIIVSESLYQRICVDGLLEKRPDGALQISSPFFEERQKASTYDALLDESRARPAKPVKKVTEISDATTFLKMRVSEKRACLRASGVLSLPRPREGPKKVDAIMIPLLDEEVAYEVLRRLGECKGDYDMAAKMNDFETRKPTLAKQYNEAIKQGKVELAKDLIEEFNSLATLRYDPSNPDEEVFAGRGGFDIEEWYWEARKRVYGIIAA